MGRRPKDAVNDAISVLKHSHDLAVGVDRVDLCPFRGGHVDRRWTPGGKRPSAGDGAHGVSAKIDSINCGILEVDANALKGLAP